MLDFEPCHSPTLRCILKKHIKTKCKQLLINLKLTAPQNETTNKLSDVRSPEPWCWCDCGSLTLTRKKACGQDTGLGHHLHAYITNDNGSLNMPAGNGAEFAQKIFKRDSQGPGNYYEILKGYTHIHIGENNTSSIITKRIMSNESSRRTGNINDNIIKKSEYTNRHWSS